MDPAPPPIGCVIKDGSYRYEMLALDRWRVTLAGRDDPLTASNLEMLYAPPREVADGSVYGRMVLIHLAKRIGGRAVFPGSGG